MQLLSTLPSQSKHMEIFNITSKYAGHVAIRLVNLPSGLNTQKFQALLNEREKIYCDYAARYDLIRFGFGSLFTNHIDVHELFLKIQRVYLEQMIPQAKL